ncbi:PAS domain S-box-containing protein [Archangium gephyra]|uniref:histidine kinase n=1 Tax=Archangium gephyra TaxID=48 RepID=A0AAC8QHD8_9BACT|nr:PAS domain-containing protein [Archangium gephyra]AKJ07389.1 diguanylate cyclase/phosphodiesterase [Archangium gephyra]REG26788.1 PAS domain S-box-containing protein [Archangium gephyra]
MRALEAIVQAPVRQEAELFRHILDALPYPIFWKGRDLRYLGCNLAFARIAGHADPGAVVGLSDHELPWRKEDVDFYRACDKQVMESGQPLPECEEPVRDSDGARRWTQTSKVPLRDERGFVFGVLGILIDVTEQRETQERLQVALTAGEAANRMLKAQVVERESMQRALDLSELRLRTAVRGAQMTLWGLDAAGIFTFSDGGALVTLGFEPGWLVGHSIFDVYAGHPEILAQTRRALAGESFTGYISFEGIHYETRYSPVFDEAGTLTGVTGLALDVTERVRYHEMLEAELERTRNQLLQVERLATLGTLAAGVGHELRNISTVLNSLRSSFRDCAQRGVPPDAEELEELGWACEHVATHGRHLMDLGRPGRSTVERMDLRELVAGALAMLRTAGITKHLKVSASVPESPLWIDASRTRVEQVLLNLVSNAADAVEVVRDRPAEVRVRLFEDRASGFVCCRVEDTGVGIPQEKLTAIFEPWFTTKPPGRGTGLGLPVVRTILQEAGGDLSVESELGKGSAFTFRLPSRLQAG